MDNIEKELREEIYRSLKNVTKENCPNVWNRIQTKDGYTQVEEMIINMVINDNITPSSCISQIEDYV